MPSNLPGRPYQPGRRRLPTYQRQRIRLPRAFVPTKPFQRLYILGLARSQGKGGAYFTQSGVTVADIQAELWRLSGSSLSKISDLELSLGRTWTDILSEPGSGEIKIMNDDPDSSSFQDTSNDLVLFRYKGWAAFMMICEQPERTVIAQGEESEQATSWSGRGHLALLERGLVYPTLGVGRKPIEEDRQFNWTSPSYDDSGWIAATRITTVGVAKVQSFVAGAGWPVAWDADFPDDTAAVLWASSGTTNFAPTGTCWVRQRVTVPVDGLYRIFFITDDNADFYLDGQFLGASTGFVDSNYFDIELTAGSHLVALRGYNAPLPPANELDPAGMAFAFYTLSNGTPVTLAAHSDLTAKIVEYNDDPPGMSVGRAMILCLQEMQARGVLTGLTWSFSATADTDGVPWPVVADIATKVGTDVLTFFRELSATYVDIWMRPGQLILDAWNLGTRGGSSGVTLRAPTDPTNPATGNLTSLILRSEV